MVRISEGGLKDLKMAIALGGKNQEETIDEAARVLKEKLEKQKEQK